MLSKVFNKKNILTIFIISIIICALASPKDYIANTLGAFILYAKNVLPALFPFIFFNKILTMIGAANDISFLLKKPFKKLYNAPEISGYVAIMSIFCGYPIGAKLTRDLYDNKAISKQDCIVLIALSSICGPIFIVGTIGTMLFKNTKYGYIILASHLLGTFINALFYKKCNCKNKINANSYSKDIVKAIHTSACHSEEATQPNNLRVCDDNDTLCHLERNKVKRGITPYGDSTQNEALPLNNNYDELLSKSMTDSILSILTVGGYIAIMSVATTLADKLFLTQIVCYFGNLLNISPTIAKGIFYGLFEMTKGVIILSSCNLSPVICLPITTFLVTFGGACIALQSMNFLSKCGVKTSKYLLIKFTQSIISTIICIILAAIFN